MADIAKVDNVNIPTPTPGKWTLAQTLSPSAVSSINSNTFSAHDRWLLEFDLVYEAETVGAGPYWFYMRLNDDAASNYRTQRTNGAGAIEGVSGNVIFIVQAQREVSYKHRFCGTIELGGKAGDNAASVVSGFINTGGVKNGYTDRRGLNFRYVLGLNDITKFNFLTEASLGSLAAQEPNAAGDKTQIESFVNTSHWNACATAGDATYVQETRLAEYQDLFNLAAAPSPPTNAILVSVTAYRRVYNSAGVMKQASGIKLGGVESWGTLENLGAAWYDKYETFISRPGGGSWAWADLADIQAGVSIKREGAGTGRCSRVNLVANYQLPCRITGKVKIYYMDY